MIQYVVSMQRLPIAAGLRMTRIVPPSGMACFIEAERAKAQPLT